MLGEIRNAGFAGVEIGYRRLKKAGADEMKRMLDDNGLILVATHVGGNLKDPGQAKSEWGMLNEIIDYLDVFGTKLIMFSGLKFIDEEQLVRHLGRFREACEYCATRGVRLAYHNHDWEFDHDGRVFNALVDEDGISFCPDLGWIHQAKEDVLGVLGRIKGRIAAVHAKDVESADKEFKAVLLGTGEAPLAAGLAWAKDHSEEDFWVISEQDSTEVSTKETAERNAAFLQSLQ
jgi:sugar phosphate isomerase/epimerase